MSFQIPMSSNIEAIFKSAGEKQFIKLLVQRLAGSDVMEDLN